MKSFHYSVLFGRIGLDHIRPVFYIIIFNQIKELFTVLTVFRFMLVVRIGYSSWLLNIESLRS